MICKPFSLQLVGLDAQIELNMVTYTKTVILFRLFTFYIQFWRNTNLGQLVLECNIWHCT